MSHETVAEIASPCPLCAAPRALRIEQFDRDGDALDVVVCRGCAVVRNHPMPDARELAAFYATRYRHEYKRTERPRLRHAVRQYRPAAEHLRSLWPLYAEAGSVLDVGCGSGEVLHLLALLGHDVEGIEPGAGYARHCREALDLRVQTAGMDEAEIGRRFGLIRCFHVLEHLPDPVAALRRMAAWLEPQGRLLVEVPDFTAYCHHKRPGGIFHAGHLYNFTAGSFERLLAAAGLAIDRRLAATTAVLRPAAGPPPEASDDQAIGQEVEAILRLYRRHRSGQAQHHRRPQRAWAKFRSRLAEQWACLQAGSIAQLAEREAARLAAEFGRFNPVAQPSTPAPA